MSRSTYMLTAFAPPAASVPPISVTITSEVAGQPCSASTMVGTVVMSRSSMIRGLVRAMYAPSTVVGVSTAAVGDATGCEPGRYEGATADGHDRPIVWPRGRVDQRRDRLNRDG